MLKFQVCAKTTCYKDSENGEKTRACDWGWLGGEEPVLGPRGSWLYVLKRVTPSLMKLM